MSNSQDPMFSIMRSLWDRVTPDLRGVAFSLVDSVLEVRLLYADSPDAATVAMVSEAETECVADFWSSWEVNYRAEHVPVDRPRTLHEDERWVFLRHEPAASA
ncbi:hypothetical protein ASG90_17695 [Nocardioides sp. Soil797]|nr:hypothetical protein ASG90_17695 [Nocardioides sp. Soil797]